MASPCSRPCRRLGSAPSFRHRVGHRLGRVALSQDRQRRRIKGPGERRCGAMFSQSAGSAEVGGSRRVGGPEDGHVAGEEEARGAQCLVRRVTGWPRKARRHLSRGKDRGRKKGRGVMTRQHSLLPLLERLSCKVDLRGMTEDIGV